ncbi:MAG: hypothetical protein WD768_01980 [Phycisphaeraceae bacterium]
MVIIRFPNEDAEDEGLGLLAERFSGRTFANGETMVPEAALEALTEEGISFTVVGPATYEHFNPDASAFRDPPAAAI